MGIMYSLTLLLFRMTMLTTLMFVLRQSIEEEPLQHKPSQIYKPTLLKPKFIKASFIDNTMLSPPPRPPRPPRIHPAPVPVFHSSKKTWFKTPQEKSLPQPIISSQERVGVFAGFSRSYVRFIMDWWQFVVVTFLSCILGGMVVLVCSLLINFCL